VTVQSYAEHGISVRTTFIHRCRKLEMTIVHTWWAMRGFKRDVQQLETVKLVSDVLLRGHLDKGSQLCSVT
jgi:hypothetical protein